MTAINSKKKSFDKCASGLPGARASLPADLATVVMLPEEWARHQRARMPALPATAVQGRNNLSLDRHSLTTSAVRLVCLATLFMVAQVVPVSAQTTEPTPRAELRRQPTSTTATNAARADAVGDPFFEPLYRNFYESYRLGPGDVVAIRVTGQPDYTVEQAKVSPVGRVYHPLLGDLETVGLTIGQLHKRLSDELAEYLLNPKVSVELIEANSAKIGVLGDVRAPGIVVMSRPMTVLDAIAAVGGFADSGSQTNVSLLRPEAGRLAETKLNIKQLYKGKASLGENPTLRAGDTLIVHGNLRKKISEITAFTGFAYFLSFLNR